MTRIVYTFYSQGGLQGGHKMILRHVETLRDLGFDAVAYTGTINKVPQWFEHRAPLIVDTGVHVERDYVVVPDDAMQTLKHIGKLQHRMLVFVQNQFNFGADTLPVLDEYPPDRRPGFLTVSPGVRDLVKHIYPAATVEMVRAFADERIFKPGGPRNHAVPLVYRKRPLEAQAIRRLFAKLHPEHADLRWSWIQQAREVDMAQAFAASSVFLSLARLESVGMTALEAMACGCLCAGFTGIGGRDFMTPENGLWVEEDDCLAAVEAVAQACDIVRTGGAELKRRQEAGYDTARQWSYAAFRSELEETWMRLAPDARIRNGPLD